MAAYGLYKELHIVTEITVPTHFELHTYTILEHISAPLQQEPVNHTPFLSVIST